MVRYIELTKNKKTLVDDDWHELLSQFKWNAHEGVKGCWYARRGGSFNGKRFNERLHRVILSTPIGVLVDHINGDGLDNRRENLRLCTHSENIRNSRPHKNASSKYKGVYWDKDRKKWRARIRVNDVLKHLGSFKSEEDAAMEYNKAAAFYFGEFAHLNTGGN